MTRFGPGPVHSPAGPGPGHLGSGLVQTWVHQVQDWTLDSLHIVRHSTVGLSHLHIIQNVGLGSGAGVCEGGGPLIPSAGLAWCTHHLACLVVIQAALLLFGHSYHHHCHLRHEHWIERQSAGSRKGKNKPQHSSWLVFRTYCFPLLSLIPCHCFHSVWFATPPLVDHSLCIITSQA